MDFARRRALYKACDPLAPLDPDDRRNVDIDEQGDSRTRPRGEKWVDRLATIIGLTDPAQPACIFFTGLPGSGKSTELRRLRARLTDITQDNFLTALIDADEYIDLSSPIDIPDIIIAVVYGAERAVLEAEGRSADEAAQESWAGRLRNWLTTTKVEFGSGQETLGSTRLSVTLRTQPTFRQRVREAVSKHLRSFLDQAHDALLQLEQRAHALGRVGLVVIVDSLEKLRGTTTSWHEVLDSAEQVFCSDAPYLRLPVHVIYTVPPALMMRNIELQFMPMLKIHDRSGQRHKAGYQAMWKIVQRRFTNDDLHALLGDACEERVEQLIAWSGGYPRDLVRLLRSALTRAPHPLSEVELARLHGEASDEYRQRVPGDAFEWLAQVACTKYLTPRDEAHRIVADLMIQQSAVLRYLNEKVWYDLHPAVAEIPEVREAIDRYKASAGMP